MAEGRRFYGKYRGTVSNNIDPTGLGRIQVTVPAVTPSNSLNWAMPCVPYAGPGVGMYFIPPQDANVWVEFEAGDPDYPIWSGGFWGTGQAPVTLVEASLVHRIKTDYAILSIDATPGAGGVKLEVNPPLTSAAASIVIDMQGITITHGGAKINLNTAKVDVNSGALEVI